MEEIVGKIDRGWAVWVRVQADGVYLRALAQQLRDELEQHREEFATRAGPLEPFVFEGPSHLRIGYWGPSTDAFRGKARVEQALQSMIQQALSTTVIPVRSGLVPPPGEREV